MCVTDRHDMTLAVNLALTRYNHITKILFMVHLRYLAPVYIPVSWVFCDGVPLLVCFMMMDELQRGIFCCFLTLSQDKSWFFTCLQFKSFENTVGKGEIARNEQFLLFPQCFLPVSITFCHFIRVYNCRIQTLSIWKSLKFVVLERVKQVLLF